jgi:hypothetical protein
MLFSCRRTSGPARRSTKGQWKAEEVVILLCTRSILVEELFYDVEMFKRNCFCIFFGLMIRLVYRATFPILIFTAFSRLK